MGNRYNENVHTKNYENTAGDIAVNFVETGAGYVVYKFRKVSGIKQLTPKGEKDLSFNPEKFNQVVNVYTGQEPVVLVWEGSTSIEVKDNVAIKKMEVGSHYVCYGNSPYEPQITNDKIELYGTPYTTEMLSKTLTLTSNDWIPDDSDMLQYFYLVIDHRAKCYQWLELSSYNVSYNEDVKKLDKTILNFSSINLKYASSGKQILDFVQLGAPGEGYAFPLETFDDKGNLVISLDPELQFDTNLVKEIQFDFSSMVGDSSFLIVGRKATNGATGEMNISQRLFLHKSNYPKNSSFFYNQANTNNYYAMDMRASKIGIWNSYKTHYQGNNNIGQQNIDKKKSVLTGFSLPTGDLTTIQESNPSMQALNWNNDLIIDVKGLVMDFSATPYVKTTIINKRMNYAEFFNMNSFVNFYVDAINYDYEEITKYKVSDTLGVLGNVFDTLVGGLDIGFTTNASLLATKQPLNLTFPCLGLLDVIGSLDKTSPIPIEIFKDDSKNNIVPLDTTLRTSWNFTLTDMVQDTSQIRPDATTGKGLGGIWDLKYLGQTKFEDGTFINDDESPFIIDLQYTRTVEPSSQDGFIIDYVNFKNASSCDVKVSTFDDKGKSNYSSMFETTAKTTGDLRLWSNSIKFNYYEQFNTIGKVNYPELVLPPKPGAKDPAQDKVIYDLSNIALSGVPTYSFPLDTNNDYIDWTKSYKMSNYQFVKYPGLSNVFVVGSRLNWEGATSDTDPVPLSWFTKNKKVIQDYIGKIETSELKQYNLDLYERLDFYFEDNNVISIPFGATQTFGTKLEITSKMSWFINQNVDGNNVKISGNNLVGNTLLLGKATTLQAIVNFNVNLSIKFNATGDLVVSNFSYINPNNATLSFVPNLDYTKIETQQTRPVWIQEQIITQNQLEVPKPILIKTILVAKVV